MRVLLSALSLLLAVALFCASADVDVPYKLCSTAGTHVNISSLTANEFPPVKGDSFNLTVNGTLDETVTSGQWSASGSYDGFPLPSSSGDIDQFKATPWPAGDMQFTYGIDVRSALATATRTRTRVDHPLSCAALCTHSLTALCRRMPACTAARRIQVSRACSHQRDRVCCTPCARSDACSPTLAQSPLLRTASPPSVLRVSTRQAAATRLS